MFSTFVVLFVIYIIFALLDMTDFDLPTGVGFLIFQPVFGIILSSFTILVCIILGLPIRLIPKLYRWWSNRPYIIFVGVFVGLTLLLLSLNSHFTETAKVTIDDKEQTKEIPNSMLALTGWVVTSFSFLHFYPMTIIKWIKKKIWTKATTNRQVA